MTIQFYRLDNSRQHNKNGMLPTPQSLLEEFNKNKWGIFWAVNEFHSSKRVIENLKKIRYWYVDMDGGDKKRLLDLINRCPLLPSIVVETKNGYHVYWRALEATLEKYSHIMNRLIYTLQMKDKRGKIIRHRDKNGKRKPLGADNNAKDLSRVLRIPGFYHWKDISDPFLVKIIHSRNVSYREDVMLKFLHKEQKKAPAYKISPKRLHISGDTLWDKLQNMNCLQALQRLSGTWAVSGEEYDFKQNTNGTYQIVVDGRKSSCWIDQNGFIGSFDKGGPTIIQWLRWFKLSKQEIERVAKEILIQEV